MKLNDLRKKIVEGPTCDYAEAGQLCGKRAKFRESPIGKVALCDEHEAIHQGIRREVEGKRKRTGMRLCEVEGCDRLVKRPALLCSDHMGIEGETWIPCEECGGSGDSDDPHQFVCEACDGTGGDHYRPVVP